jgi:outer membrane assembly lipoprotein YfiO
MKKHFYFIVLLGLLSCSSKAKENPDKASEVPNKEVVATDLPPGELLQKSKRLYENALYSTSVESFQSLRDAYSPGPYSEFAEIKMADSNFEMRKFDLSAANYEEFLKNHPSSKSVAYALLRAGRSHELSNTGVGRDLAPLEKAKVHYEKLIEQYPDSVYTHAARKYYQDIAQKIADQDKFVRDFYRKREKEDAAKAREEHFKTEIEPILAKAGSQAEEDKIEVAKAKSPSDKTLASAKISEVSEVQNTSSVSVMRKVPAPAVNETRDMAKTAYRVQSVKCTKTGGENLTIFLNKEYSDEKFLEKNEVIASNNGLLEFSLPDTSSKELELDCFTKSDLKVSKNGKISLVNSGQANMISLANPPRLLLSFE